MNVYPLFYIGMLALTNSLFAQCPKQGIEIQSAACEEPKNLKVYSITCSEMKVKWLGNKNQTYVVKANYTNPEATGTVEAKVSENTCDDNGTCSTTIAVKEGTNVNWSVQAVCLVDKATLYSTEVIGKNTYIPFCQKTAELSSIKTLYVYPNPATDYLIIAYSGNEGLVELSVLDVTGKKVLNKQERAVKATNQYKLDLRNLSAGMYLLEFVNGKDVHHAKFVLL